MPNFSIETLLIVSVLAVLEVFYVVFSYNYCFPSPLPPLPHKKKEPDNCGVTVFKRQMDSAWFPVDTLLLKVLNENNEKEKIHTWVCFSQL